MSESATKSLIDLPATVSAIADIPRLIMTSIEAAGDAQYRVREKRATERRIEFLERVLERQQQQQQCQQGIAEEQRILEIEAIIRQDREIDQISGKLFINTEDNGLLSISPDLTKAENQDIERFNDFISRMKINCGLIFDMVAYNSSAFRDQILYGRLISTMRKRLAIIEILEKLSLTLVEQHSFRENFFSCLRSLTNELELINADLLTSINEERKELDSMRGLKRR